MDTESMTPEMRIKYQALRWSLDLVDDHEREEVRAMLEGAGRVLGDDGVWREKPRERRADPPAASGELGTRECTTCGGCGSVCTPRRSIDGRAVPGLQHMVTGMHGERVG